MPTVVLKLFAGQGTVLTDGQSGDYVSPFGEHKHTLNTLLVTSLGVSWMSKCTSNTGADNTVKLHIFTDIKCCGF